MEPKRPVLARNIDLDLRLPLINRLAASIAGAARAWANPHRRWRRSGQRSRRYLATNDLAHGDRVQGAEIICDSDRP